MTTHPVLAVCGSGLGGTPAFSAAVRTDHGLAVALPSPGTRGELAVLVRQALAEAGVAAHELGAIYVDRGPGSYIGLRVAVTFARCLAAFAPAELLAIDSLAAAAAATWRSEPGWRLQRVCVVLDGRNARLQAAAYRLRAGTVATESPPTLLADSEFAAFVQPADVVVASTGLAERLRGLHADGLTLQQLPDVGAADLLAAGLPATPVTALELEPLYLSGSYAS